MPLKEHLRLMELLVFFTLGYKFSILYPLDKEKGKKIFLKGAVINLRTKIIGEKFGCYRKKPYLCRAFCKNNLLFTYLTYYEPIRNRFHFDSRFV